MADTSEIVKALGQTFDPSKVMEQVNSMLSGLKMPGIDVDTLLASQKGMFEALTAANRTALEGFQALMQRQMEMLQETMGETANIMQGLAKNASSPQTVVAGQVDFAQASLQKAVSNMRELADMASNSYWKAMDKIYGSVAGQLSTLKDVAMKATPKATPKA